tara:strand:+ start:2339 stop:2806 length:468 start_codon:yes stop_codon:yes gene_type:complete
MDQKILIKTLSYPLLTSGIIMIILGLRWVINPEPWLLDEIANVERLGMSFDDLFKAEINKTLPGYLKQIYEFFGLWVIIIGLFITNYSLPKKIIKKDIAIPLLTIFFFLVISGLFFGYKLIPNSHFIYLGWMQMIAFIISLFSFYKLESAKNETM